jgi:hypothetical protein
MLGDEHAPTLSRELYALQAQDIFKSSPWSMVPEAT